MGMNSRPDASATEVTKGCPDLPLHIIGIIGGFIMAELNKSYDPKLVEDRIYRFWMDNNYFHAVAHMDINEALERASYIWEKVNYANLIQNILPTRERADLILTKGEDHTVQKIKLKK